MFDNKEDIGKNKKNEEIEKDQSIVSCLINSIYSLESNYILNNLIKRELKEENIFIEDNNINSNVVNLSDNEIILNYNYENLNDNNIIEIDKKLEFDTKDKIDDKILKYDYYFILVEKIKNCKDCKLYQNRNNTVPGTGNLKTNIMFIGEGPGEQEDIQGLPFVGKAGKLLDRALYSCGFDRKNIYITNVVKCRPPNNRNPEKDEIISCYKYLVEQIKIISPKLIVSLGKISANTLLRANKNISEIRGKFIKLSNINYLEEVPIFFATYHPSAILRNPNLYSDFVNDLKSVYNFAKKKNYI